MTFRASSKFVPMINLYREPEAVRKPRSRASQHPCLQELDVQCSGSNRELIQRELQNVLQEATSNNVH